MTEPSLRLNAVTLAYDDEPVVAAIDLSVPAGEIVALLGASGCGKSSILRAIAGFLTPRSGTIELNGQTMSAAIPPQQRRLGMVFQHFALFRHLSVADNIRFGLHQRGDAAERTSELLTRFGLDDLAGRLPEQLSGGQQQRVGLARALAPAPNLLLLDEPFANLDIGLRHDLGAWCSNQIRAAGAAALLVTHDPNEAANLSDRVILLGGSPVTRVLASGDAKTLYEQPPCAESAAMLGPVLTLAIAASGGRATSAVGDLDLAQPGHGPQTALIRPQRLCFAEGEANAEVLRSVFQAGRHGVEVLINEQRLTLWDRDAVAPGPCRLRCAGPVWAVGS